VTSEVIVVGGGPAGAATAWFLARAGVDVLVLDRARFPRDKPCAEYLSPQASRILDAMGVLEAAESAGGAQLSGQGGQVIKTRGPVVDTTGKVDGIAVVVSEVTDQVRARVTAERLAQSKIGVIAWSRTGDAELGDFDEEPVILFRAGRIPAELEG